ncbi:MAG: hypothetical protein WDO13_07720 [Verrucomicrobiota bacterium]
MPKSAWPRPRPARPARWPSRTSTPQANALLQQSIVLDPTNPIYPRRHRGTQREQVAYEEQVRDPEGTTNNPL